MPEILWDTQYDEQGVPWLYCNLARIGLRLEDDGQASGAFLMVGGPLAAKAALGNILAKGDRGFSPTLQVGSTTFIDPDSPEQESYRLTEIAPPTEISGPVYSVDVVIRRGAKGDDGDAVWDPADLSEDPQLGYVPAVAAGVETFELVPQKVSSQHWPATVNNVPAATPTNYTVAIVPIAAAPYDRYAIPFGTIQVAASSGTNLRVDLVARLDADDGPDIGRDYGRAGASDKLTLVGFPPAGTTSSATKILANQSANIYICTEKQSGSVGYSSVAGTGRYGVTTVPA